MTLLQALRHSSLLLLIRYTHYDDDPPGAYVEHPVHSEVTLFRSVRDGPLSLTLPSALQRLPACDLISEQVCLPGHLYRPS